VAVTPSSVGNAVASPWRRALNFVRRTDRRTPLRVKLIGGLMVLVIAALIATGIAGTHLLRGYLVSRVDAQLSQVTQGIVHRPGTGFPDGPGLNQAVTRDEYYLVFVPAGSKAASGAPLLPYGQQAASPPRVSANDVDSRGGDYFTTGAKAGHGSWRVYVYDNQVVTTQGQQGTLALATPLSEVNNTVHRLLMIDLGVSAIILVALGVFGWVLVRATLQPLVDIEETAGAIAAGDLSQRVDEGDPHTEVGRLSIALNGMLTQIESAFREREASEASAKQSEDRMRRFVADASHELRTPLTSIRGFAELYRQGAVSSPEDLRRMMRRVEEEATRMGLLVEDLLLLARLDQQRPLEQQPVDLLVLTADAVHDARAVQPDRPIELEIAADTAPVVVGDEARLRQVIGNLVTNALTHTPRETPVTVRLATTSAGDGRAWALIGVSDEGPGLVAAEAARVFERFYRADKSRTRAQGGSGLGLSIVAALVAAHGGRVDVVTAPGEGATFTVRLPLAPESQSEHSETLTPTPA
jgi:two-component system OmpR family sensor kinase